MPNLATEDARLNLSIEKRVPLQQLAVMEAKREQLNQASAVEYARLKTEYDALKVEHDTIAAQAKTSGARRKK